MGVSVEGDTNITINARGDLGWKVEANYSVEEGGALVRKGMKAVGQPLQADVEVEQDENMKPVQTTNDTGTYLTRWSSADTFLSKSGTTDQLYQGTGVNREALLCCHCGVVQWTQ